MSAHRPADRHCPPHGGFSLVEVLVALVLLSIGLLGLARLQTLSLQRADSAALRNVAVGHSYDLLDRMRINRAQAIGGRYNIAFGSDPGGGDLASADLADWKRDLAARLPDGDGQVIVEAQVVTITVQWGEAAKLPAAGNTAATVSLRTQL